MPSSSLPPERFSKPPCHRFRHFGLGVLYIGLRAPWNSQSGQIPKPNPGFRQPLRVHPVWILGLSRRRRVSIQKHYASNYYSNPCHKCDDTYISRQVVQCLD